MSISIKSVSGIHVLQIGRLLDCNMYAATVKMRGKNFRGHSVILTNGRYEGFELK